MSQRSPDVAALRGRTARQVTRVWRETASLKWDASEGNVQCVGDDPSSTTSIRMLRLSLARTSCVVAVSENRQLPSVLGRRFGRVSKYEADRYTTDAGNVSDSDPGSRDVDTFL